MTPNLILFFIIDKCELFFLYTYVQLWLQTLLQLQSLHLYLEHNSFATKETKHAINKVKNEFVGLHYFILTNIVIILQSWPI